MKRILAATIIGTFLWLTGCGFPGYDKPRYSETEQATLKGSNGLVGLPAAEATTLLRLQHVRWDAGCLPQTDDQLRIYHFRGFFLELPLTHHLPRPKTNTATGSVELSDDRNWWVAPPGPALHIDRIGSSGVRMSN